MTPYDEEDEYSPIEGEFSVVPDEESPEIEATSRELSQDEIDERHHTQAALISDQYQRIILPEGATKVDAIEKLAKDTPMNEYGLPLFFFRSDLLPYNLGTLTQDEADAAMVNLDYTEGYPTYQDGRLFWQQLPHESSSDYLLFQRFCDMAEQTGIRTIHMLAHDQSVGLLRVQVLYTEYFWKARARAYDLFQVAADRKLRERRSRRLEDEHYKQAASLMQKLSDRLDDPELFNNLTGKEAIEVLRLLINIQRVSAGQPQNGNAGGIPFNADAAKDSRDIMEDITKSIQREDNGLGLGDGLSDLMANDANFVFEAQKIILKMRHRNDPNAQATIKPIDSDF